MNKSDKVYDRERFILDMTGGDCCANNDNTDISEYDRSIDEINGMIQYFIDSGNKKEVADWRKMLQRAKVEKRRVKKMIENNNGKEIAYT